MTTALLIAIYVLLSFSWGFLISARRTAKTNIKRAKALNVSGMGFALASFVVCTIEVTMLAGWL